MDKLLFFVINYFQLLVFLSAGFVTGYVLLRSTSLVDHIDRVTAFLLSIVLGVGCLIVIFFLLAAIGFLTKSVILVLGSALLVVGCAETIRIGLRNPVTITTSLRNSITQFREKWYWLLIFSIAAIPLLLAPLQPPLGWDELAYQLPTAKGYAESGALVVNPYLRYPLHAYNYNLLYAVALIFHNDVLPHLIHAVSGWLVAFGILQLCRVYFKGSVIGLFAAIIYLSEVKVLFSLGYVDLGLGLFVFYAFYCLIIWYDKSQDGFLYLAVFFISLAIGTKYIGLWYLLVFGVIVLAKARRFRPIINATGIFLAFGTYWYIHNYLISGDPVHPLGGEYFGYWLWDRHDLEGQYQDLASRAERLPRILAFGLVSVLFLPWSSTAYRILCFSAYTTFLIWWNASHQMRYLIPAFPFLAILAAYSLYRCGAWLTPPRWLQTVRQWLQRLPVRVVLKALLLAVVVKSSLESSQEPWSNIQTTEQDRHHFLAKRLEAYEILQLVASQPDVKIYQLGFENHIYYSANPIIGDWFGPGRYSDLLPIAGDTVALRQHLRQLGVNSLLINKDRRPFSNLHFDAHFRDHFDLLAENETAVLYVLKCPTTMQE